MPNLKTQCWVVIPAAGIGARVGADRPKQYIKIAGLSILEHSTQAFIDCDFIEGIVLAVAEHDSYLAEVKQLDHPKISQCVGGATRAESVLAGLQALKNKAKDTDWVMVHDAARPCLNAAEVTELYTALASSQSGGLWATPVAETLKRSDASFVLETIDRTDMWRAQTPQMFRLGELTKALSAALAQKLAITDESSAMEFMGAKPQLIEGPAHNIKVTYPADVALATYYLQETKVPLCE